MVYSADMMYDIYNKITGCDEEFIKNLACAAIATALEIQTDMYRDREDDAPTPDDNDIRCSALGFVDDMVSEFQDNLLTAIKALNFTANIEKVQAIKSNLVFE